jgi:uncharacterized membrane protein YkoI
MNNRVMSRKLLLTSLLVLGLVATLATAVRADDEDKADNKKPEARAKVRPNEAESGLQIVAQAKLSRQEAERIALARVPGGKVKAAELELEDGVLIWSFDVTLPDTDLMAEVAVNAVTGAVVKTELEAPKAEARQAKKEQPEAKAKPAKAERKEAKPKPKEAKPEAKKAKEAKALKAEAKERKAEVKEAKAQAKKARAKKIETKAETPKPKDRDAKKTKPTKGEDKDQDED